MCEKIKELLFGFESILEIFITFVCFNVYIDALRKFLFKRKKN